MPTINDHIPLLDHRITALEEERTELKGVLKELAVAVQKLVIIDQRQVDTATILDRLTSNIDGARQRIDVIHSEICRSIEVEREKREEFKKELQLVIKELDSRIDVLEKADVDNKRVRNWAFGLVTMMAAAIVAGVFKLIGLSTS